MRKRFIAGATCPQCGLQDKIFVYQKEGEDLRQCNACGFVEPRPRDVPSAPPATEVDGVVKIIRNPQDKAH